MEFSKFAVLYGPFCVYWSKMNLEHLSSSNGLVCSKKKFLKSSLKVFSEATLDLIFKNIPKSPEIQIFEILDFWSLFIRFFGFKDQYFLLEHFWSREKSDFTFAFSWTISMTQTVWVIPSEIYYREKNFIGNTEKGWF